MRSFLQGPEASSPPTLHAMLQPNGTSLNFLQFLESTIFSLALQFLHRRLLTTLDS